MKMETVNTAIGASNNAMGVGTGMSFYGLVTSSGFVALAGMMMGLIGLLVNIYFKRQDAIRRQQIHALQVARLKRETPIDFCYVPKDEDTE